MVGTKQFASNYLARRDEAMTTIRELNEQAARAERLVKSVSDNLTIERLTAFAVECRTRIEVFERRSGETEKLTINVPFTCSS
jgi:hypothetical protein